MLVVVRLLPMFVSGMACNIFVGLMAYRVPVVYLVSTYELTKFHPIVSSITSL